MNVSVYIKNSMGMPELITEMGFAKNTNKLNVILRIRKEGILVGEHTYYPPQSIFKVCFS